MAGHSSSMANTFDGARIALRRIRLHPSATLANSATGKAVPAVAVIQSEAGERRVCASEHLSEFACRAKHNMHTHVPITFDDYEVSAEASGAFWVARRITRTSRKSVYFAHVFFLTLELVKN